MYKKTAEIIKTMATSLDRFTHDFYKVLRSCNPTVLKQLNLQTMLPFDEASSASTCHGMSPLGSIDIGLTVVERAVTKGGSKQIQREIERCSPKEIEVIVQNVKGQIAPLMSDTYGNYMCQKLFQICNSVQRLELLEAMEDSLVSIAMDTRGTHSLQILIGLASMTEEEQLYERAFRGHIIRLSRHEFGSHVVQKMAMTLRNRDFIVRPVTEFVRELSLHQLGLCVVKQLIDSPEVYRSLVPHCLELIQDPYGNYAVQRLLEVWGSRCHSEIEAHLSNKLVQLSIQKYSSNVIEQCLSEPDLGTKFAIKLVKVESLHVLLPNVYGCFVLKSLKSKVPKMSSTLIANIHTAVERIHKNKLKGRREQIDKLLTSEKLG